VNKVDVDKILGDSHMRQKIKHMGTEVLVPFFKKHSNRSMWVKEIDTYYVMPDYHYYRRLEILEILNVSLIEYVRKSFSTLYFKSSSNILLAIFRVLKFRWIYKSIVRNGMEFSDDDVWTMPWLFASKDCVLRLDGSHRASIARHENHKTIKTVVMTPKLLLADVDIELTDEYRSFLNNLEEPDVNLDDSFGVRGKN
jgi:hypothetical protein